MKSNTAPPAELDNASEGMAEAYRMALATATRDARTATTAMLAFSATLPEEEQGVYRTMLRSDARDCLQTGVGRILAHPRRAGNPLRLRASGQLEGGAGSRVSSDAHHQASAGRMDRRNHDLRSSPLVSRHRDKVARSLRGSAEIFLGPWSLLGLAHARSEILATGLGMVWSAPPIQMTGMNTLF